MKIEEKSWNEFWAAYWRIDCRHQIAGIFEWDRKLVDYIETVCDLQPGMAVLDLGCGGGDQAIHFARKGYAVTGIDIAPPLIKYAARQFAMENLPGEFIAGDMRAIEYGEQFDAVLILSGTFGFFSDEENLALLRAIHRALKPGGRVFINYLEPQRGNEKPSRTWQEIPEGWQLTETWHDAETATYRSRNFIIRKDGVMIIPKTEPGYHADEIIRCYTVPEMKTLFRQSGLHYLAGYTTAELSLPPKPLSPGTNRNVAVGKRDGG